MQEPFTQLITASVQQLWSVPLPLLWSVTVFNSFDRYFCYLITISVQQLLNTVIRGEDRSTDHSCWTLTVIRGENRSTDQSCWTLWSGNRNSDQNCWTLWLWSQKRQKHWSKLLNTVIRGGNRNTDQNCWTLTVIREQKYWSKLLNTDCDQITKTMIKTVEHCD